MKNTSMSEKIQIYMRTQPALVRILVKANKIRKWPAFTIFIVKSIKPFIIRSILIKVVHDCTPRVSSRTRAHAQVRDSKYCKRINVILLSK